MPVVTYGLIFLNIVIYFSSKTSNFQSALLSQGFRLDQNAWYTWFTSAFMHADPMHLGSNMLFLYVFGSFLEDILGEIKFISVYVLGAFASSFILGMVNALFIPQAASVPVIGASGAISALLGIAMVRFRDNDLYVFYFYWLILVIIRWGTFAIKTYVAVVIYFLIQVASGLLQIASGAAGGVAYWAHIGGFAAGVVSVYLLGLKKEAEIEEKEDKAMSWLKMGNARAAASLSSELIKDDPNNANYYQLAGEADLDRGDFESAYRNYCRAIELYLKNRDIDMACLIFEEICGRTTLPQKIQFAVSSACESSGKFQLSIDGFKRFREAYPDDPRAELALIRIGQLHEKMGETDKAIAAYNDFLSEYPQSEWIDWVKQRLRKALETPSER